VISRSDGGWIAGWTAADGCIRNAGPATPLLRKASVVFAVPRDQKSGQPFVIEIEHNQRFGVAGHQEGRFRPPAPG